MRLVATSRLIDGALLGRDVRTGAAEHAPLLRAGTAITPEYRAALIRQGINAVYVDDELSAGIDRKSTRLNSSHVRLSRMPSSA